MKKLELEFEGKGEVKGVNFKQVKRSETHAVYERSDGYYEVIPIVKREAVTIVNRDYPPMEIYPKGEAWNGKCVSSLERAIELFESPWAN